MVVVSVFKVCKHEDIDSFDMVRFKVIAFCFVLV